MSNYCYIKNLYNRCMHDLFLFAYIEYTWGAGMSVPGSAKDSLRYGHTWHRCRAAQFKEGGG